MLMDQIVAIFLAQLLYMAILSGMFKGRQVLCQTQAAAQYYFWLASFVRMAYMSLEISICLSLSYTIVTVHVGVRK